MPLANKLPLGKKPARYDRRTLSFATYQTPSLAGLATPQTLSKLPPRPRHFGHQNLVNDWGMLGNDQYGDCVWAGAAHETMLWAAAARPPGTPPTVQFSTESVLSAYSQVTGFSPNDPASDQGTDMLSALNYRRTTGIQDLSSTVHKICAYVSLEPGDTDQLLNACYLFGGVGIGIQFPDSAQTQFQDGEPWSYTPGATLLGGHYVPVVGYNHSYLEVVTWGRTIKMSKRFYQKYCDEAYAILDDEMLSPDTSLSPEGFDFAALQADLAEVTA